MATKQSKKRGKGRAENTISVECVQGINRKRVIAIGVGGRHPCPGESPSRKKKSLSQFVSPSPNSKKRMQAAISAARKNSKPNKKSRAEVGVTLPISTSCAFEHVVDYDAVVREAEETTDHQNLELSSSQIHLLQKQPSPIAVTNLQHNLQSRDLEGGQGSGVHVHIYVTPPQAQKSQRQDNTIVDPLVRAKRILEFLHGTSNLDGVEPSPRSPQQTSPFAKAQQTDSVEVPCLEVVHTETAFLEEFNGDEGVSVEVIGEPRSLKRGEEMQVLETLSPIAPENGLNSRRYGEVPVCQEKAGLAKTHYSWKDSQQILSFLPLHEIEEFLRTHPTRPIENPPPKLAIVSNVVDCPTDEGGRHEFFESSSLKSPIYLLPSDAGKEKLVTEAQHQETLRQLRRDEKKYQKKQAKKRAEEKRRCTKTIEKVAGSKKVPFQKSLLARGHQLTSPVDSNTLKRLHDVSSSSPSSNQLTPGGDSTQGLISWDTIHDIPPFQVNSLTAPIGEFWEHMRQHALEQAPFEFPWHIEWNRQCPELKARFILKLRKIYLGPWDPKSVLKAVGANLRERRTRLKGKFEKCMKINQVSRPAGCSKGSWILIYESTKDVKKQRKAKLCKEAADKRFEEQGPTHRCGPRGIKGLYDRFVHFFKRPPTNEELEFGKMNGWLDLQLKVQKALDVQDDGRGKQINPQEGCHSDPLFIDSVVQDQVKLPSGSDTSALGSSTDSSSDGGSSMSESE